MAEDGILLAVDQFKCPVCLDLLSDPVTIPCGHSYCMNCIKGCWDQNDQKRVYSCPECRQTFTPRPVLGKNVMLAEMVEKLKKRRAKLRPSVPAHRNAGPGDAQCVPQDNRHNTVDTTGRLQETLCPRHGELLDMYCFLDAQCICKQCVIAEHRFHSTVYAVTARSEKQGHLENMQRQVKHRIEQKIERLQKQIDVVESHKHTAQAAVEDTEKLFDELISSIQKSCRDVIQLIRDQETAAVSRDERLLAQLQQEIDDLEKRDIEIQQLSQIQNHNHFLQGFQNLSQTESTDLLSLFSSGSLLSLDGFAGGSVTQLREYVQQFCKQQIVSVSNKVTYLQETFAPKYEDWGRPQQLSSPLWTLPYDSGMTSSRTRLQSVSRLSAPSPSTRKRFSWSPRSLSGFPNSP